MKTYSLEVDDHDQLRVDVYLVNHNPTSLTRSGLKKLIASGFVSLTRNGQVIKLNPGTRLKPADKLIVQIPPAPKPIKLDIIYQDNDVTVINKPAGVLSHEKNVLLDGETTILASAKKYLTEPVTRDGIVHRLDRQTSGVMIIARNQASYDLLKTGFKKRDVIKEYWAICYGQIAENKLEIRWPIGRDSKKPFKQSVNSHGKEAVSVVKKIAGNNQYSVVQVLPKTGRTHQIRVHLSHLGFPIVGESLYAKTKTKPANHLYLYAKSLTITIPSKKNVQFNAPLPQYFEEFFNNQGFKLNG